MIAAWLLTRAAMVTVLIHEYLAPKWHSWLPTDISYDVRHGYLIAASRMAHGAIPYADFHYEYPPGTLPFLGIARAVSGPSPGRFLVAWVALMVLLDLAVLVGLTRAARNWTTPPVAFWVLALPALGPMALARNDVITLAAVVGAVLALRRDKDVLAGALLCFAVLTKVWPVVVLGLVLLLRSRRDARAIAIGAVATAVFAVIALAAVGALGPMLDSLTAYHSHRPLEIESSWAVALLAITTASGHPIHPVYTYLSFNIPRARDHGLAPIAYRLSYVIQAIGLAIALAIRRSTRSRANETTTWWLALAVVAGGLAIAPVFSPQYVLWIDAIVVAVLLYDQNRQAMIAAAMTLAISVLTQAEYPFLFASLHAGAPAGIAITAIRDLAVGTLAVYAAATVAAKNRRPQPD